MGGCDGPAGVEWGASVLVRQGASLILSLATRRVNCRPLVEIAVVDGVGDRSFGVVVPRLGVEARLHFDGTRVM